VEAHVAGAEAAGGGAGRGGPAGVVDEDLARAEDLEAAVGPDEDGRGLLDAKADQGGAPEDQADETVVTLAGDEVLVDDDARQETEAAGGRDVVRFDRRPLAPFGRLALLVAGDHDLAHHGRAGARAAERAPGAVELAESGMEGRVEESRGQARLVAAREPDAAGPVEQGGARGIHGFVAGQLVEDDLGGAEGPELGDGLRPDLERHAAGHGENDDPACAEAFGQLDEAPHQGRVAVPAADDEEVPLGAGIGRGAGAGAGQGQ
jgi:hypothetical protein